MQHEWIKSTLGHGEVMCRLCHITNREAAVIGSLNGPCPRARADMHAMVTHDGASLSVEHKPEAENDYVKLSVNHRIACLQPDEALRLSDALREVAVIARAAHAEYIRKGPTDED